MRSKGKRNIQDGSAYTELFPKPLGTSIRIPGEAEVEDTLKMMQQKLPEASAEVVKIARVLKGNDLYKTCSNLWHFIYDHIQYAPDTMGVEQVRSPKRTWADRGYDKGVDCDCYSMFIGACLAYYNIPFVWRIAKYPKKPPEEPRWQHIYPIVPLDRNKWNSDDPETYITVDCVKDGFDEEEPYLEKKDFIMRLEYLEGLDDNEQDYSSEHVDGTDLAAYDDDDLGNIFKSIGNGISKKFKQARKYVNDSYEHQKRNIPKKAKEAAKWVDKNGGAALRFVNRIVNPATILLRNGFLLAMKENMFNVAGRLKYAYLTDEQAKKRGMNPGALASLRNIKQKAETIYWQAGGIKSNLRRGILTGNGNKGRDVPVAGLDGLTGFGNIYADQDEYNILHNNTMNGLGEFGEIATGTALAAAAGAVGALAKIIGSIKGLFPGKKDEGNNSNSGGGNSDAVQDSYVPEPASAAGPVSPASSPENLPSFTDNSGTIIQNGATERSNTFTPRTETNYSAYNTPTPPGASFAPANTPQPSAMREETSAALTTTDNSTSPATEGFIDKVKKNPWPWVVGAGVVLGGGYMLLKKKPSGGGLSGFSHYKKKKNKSRKGHGNKKARKSNVQSIHLRR